MKAFFINYLGDNRIAVHYERIYAEESAFNIHMGYQYLVSSVEVLDNDMLKVTIRNGNYFTISSKKISFKEVTKDEIIEHPFVIKGFNFFSFKFNDIKTEVDLLKYVDYFFKVKDKSFMEYDPMRAVFDDDNIWSRYPSIIQQPTFIS